ncbi:MAG: hypothetical protein DME40_00695 [Verrucomicrobia bacterium]|nr:MAG: hypothetical protein DME37_11645 [Verrucomicrobiota bacterium]PYK95429.1 MAG: hypothetical protein DME40_00695 [Verrucomicrobiota bacterium]PYM09979.1 MAG: hypothetical protein DMF15_03710 [Verrucomicrobiota bacterium]
MRDLDGCFAVLVFFCSKNLHFPRNSRPNLAQYISERPAMISHDEKPKKAKTTKTKSSTSTKDINYATQQNSLCGNRAVYGCLLLHDGLGTLRVGFHARTAYHHCYI